MSVVASHVILHPAVSQTLKMWSATAGRDKTYRAVQYLSRFLAWYLLTHGDKVQAARFSALKSHLGTARKLMRLGKPMEHLQAALRAAHSPGEAAQQVAKVGRQLCYFGYLSYDTLIWANTVKFLSLQPETAKRVSKISNRFWLAGILFGLAHGILELRRLSVEATSLRAKYKASEKGVGEQAELGAKAHALKSARAATLTQFTSDILDVWLPTSNLGIVNLNDGVLGLIGFVTSLMALRKQWETAGNKY